MRHRRVTGESCESEQFDDGPIGCAPSTTGPRKLQEPRRWARGAPASDETSNTVRRTWAGRGGPIHKQRKLELFKFEHKLFKF